PAQRKWPSSAKIGFGLILLGATVGGLIWGIAQLFPPSPAFLLLPGANYVNNPGVPLNLYGWQGLKDLEEFAKEERPVLWWHRRLFGGGKTDVLDVPERLEDAFKDGFKEQTILIYLALHGGGNDRDGAYLVPGDFKVYPGPKDKKGSDALLRVRDVLDLLKQWPKKNKVLILDATQVVA